MKAAAGWGCCALPSLALFELLVLPLRPLPLVFRLLLLPPPSILLLHSVDAVAALTLVAFVAVAAKPFSQQLQIVQRRPPSDSEVFITRGPDLEVVGTQVEVMAGAGVPADAAAVPLAQEVTADLSGPCHIDNVLTQTVAEEGLHPGAVILLKQSNTSCCDGS